VGTVDELGPEEVFAENMGLAPWAVRRYQIPRTAAMDHEDLEQIAYIALWMSANTFDPERGYKFSTFAVTAIHNDAFKVIRGYKAKKRNEVSLSIDFTAEDDRGYETSAMAFLKGSDLDDTAACVNEFVQSLSPLKRRVLMLRLDGYKQHEIADRIGVSQKHVSRTLVAIGKEYRARYMRG